MSTIRSLQFVIFLMQTTLYSAILQVMSKLLFLLSYFTALSRSFCSFLPFFDFNRISSVYYTFLILCPPIINPGSISCFHHIAVEVKQIRLQAYYIISYFLTSFSICSNFISNDIQAVLLPLQFSYYSSNFS